MTHVDIRLGEQHSRATQRVVDATARDHQPSGCVPWACVHTHSQTEHWAAENLQRRGYQVYLPLVAVTRRNRIIRSMRHNVLVPLFPRYAFVQLPRSAPWSPIQYTPGVSNLITAHGSVCYARAGAVEALQASEDARRMGGSRDAAGRRVEASWRPGEACEIVGGPFNGHRGVVEDVGAKLALVRILMFGNLRNAAVNPAQLAPVEA